MCLSMERVKGEGSNRLPKLIWEQRLCENAAWFQKIAAFMIISWALGIILYIQDAISQAGFEFSHSLNKHACYTGSWLFDFSP